MAKLADALASGASDSNIMEVQVLSTAPFLFSKLILQLNMRLWRNWQTRYFEGVVFTRRMGSSPINRTRNYPDIMSGFLLYIKKLAFPILGIGQLFNIDNSSNLCKNSRVLLA